MLFTKGEGQMTPFKEDIMTSVPYYEVNKYVAEYVQELLEEVGEEKIPVSIHKILDKLEIKQETNFTPSDTTIGSIHGAELCIAVVPNVGKDSDYGHWHMLKCIAKIIIGKGKPKCERYINLPGKNESLANMLAYELMLPYKQAIPYFSTKEFFEKVSKNLLSRPISIRKETQIGELIHMDYPVFQKTLAFYHLLEVCESMIVMRQETVEMHKFCEMIGAWKF